MRGGDIYIYKYIYIHIKVGERERQIGAFFSPTDNRVDMQKKELERPCHRQFLILSQAKREKKTAVLENKILLDKTSSTVAFLLALLALLLALLLVSKASSKAST